MSNHLLLSIMINAMINKNKIKYVKMDEIFQEKSFNKKVNIFIDLTNIVKSLYIKGVAEELSAFSNFIDKFSIISDFVGISSHYRKYFYRRFGSNTNIYYIYMNKPPIINRKEYKDYGTNIISVYRNVDFQLLNDYMKESIKLFCSLSRYLPKIDVVLTDGKDTSILPKVILESEEEFYNDSNVIVTTDNTFYQYLKFDNWSILYPRGDNSKLITSDNLYSEVCKKLTYRPQNISPEYLSVLYALTGLRHRNITSVKGCGLMKICKLLENINGLNCISVIQYILKEIDKEDMFDEILKRYRSIDIDVEDSLLRYEDRNISQYINDGYRSQELDIINSKFFINNSLDLNGLITGTEYEN